MPADRCEIRRERIHIAEEGVQLTVEFTLAAPNVFLHAVQTVETVCGLPEFALHALHSVIELIACCPVSLLSRRDAPRH